MKANTPPTLRAQVIDAMNAHAAAQGWADRTPAFNADMFEQAIMPVLQKAIEAGHLMVSRNTGERIPIHKALHTWLEHVTAHVMMIRMEEATVSKRSLLRLVYQFGDNAERALRDVEAAK